MSEENDKLKAEIEKLSRGLAFLEGNFAEESVAAKLRIEALENRLNAFHSIMGSMNRELAEKGNGIKSLEDKVSNLGKCVDSDMERIAVLEGRIDSTERVHESAAAARHDLHGRIGALEHDHHIEDLLERMAVVEGASVEMNQYKPEVSTTLEWMHKRIEAVENHFHAHLTSVPRHDPCEAMPQKLCDEILEKVERRCEDCSKYGDAKLCPHPHHRRQAAGVGAANHRCAWRGM